MTIVVGYVPNPEGRTALRRAIAEALLRNEKLVVVNAARGDSYADPRVAAVEELAWVQEQLSASGLPHELHQLVRGKDPAEEVIDVAIAEQATLIVIGLRRRSPVGKLFLGSTSQHILLDADCPVLAVKAEAG